MKEESKRKERLEKYEDDAPTLHVGHPVFMNYRGEELEPPFEFMEELVGQLESLDAQGASLPPSPEWAKGVLRAIYEMVDLLGGRIAPRMACDAGCSACCRVMVSTSSVEASLIRDRMDRESSGQKKIWAQRIQDRNGRLRMLSEKSDPPADLSTFDGLLSTCEDWERENLPCPFLGAGNLCGIYEDRPLLCRVCWVLTNPADCEPGAGPPVKFRTQVFEKAYFVVANLSKRHLENGAVSPIPWWLESH